MEIRVRPIHNDDDHNAALAEIGALMDAAAGTPEGDRLDVLATFVEAYLGSSAFHVDVGGGFAERMLRPDGKLTP